MLVRRHYHTELPPSARANLPNWLTDPWLTDWLHLWARWFHVVVGAGWIGASFYFTWLNNNVRPVEDASGRLAGGLWAVHGGAFYEVRKYKGAPERLPTTLHWFKWEAYLTWLSGIVLLLLVYWLQAGVMMIPAGSALTPATATGLGVATLTVGWVVYDRLCRSPLVAWPRAFAALGFLLLAATAWGLCQVYTPRAAWIHLGAMMGTMMALNVFFVIIPGQRAMVEAMVRDEPPPLERGRAGALRSLHNNYLTLPVLFVMVSNHFPFTYGHPLPWAVLVGIGGLGAAVRHGLNLHDRGEHNSWLLPAAAAGLVAMAFVVHGPRAPVEATSDAVPTAATIEGIVSARCAPCHAESPTYPGIAAPPKGLVLRTAAHVKTNAVNVTQQAVRSAVMPPGNLTGITPEERDTLGRWLAAGAPL